MRIRTYPEKLDWDESFGKSQGGGQEDADDLADVGGDQVTDELLHVVVDGATLLNRRHDGSEVVVWKLKSTNRLYYGCRWRDLP